MLISCISGPENSGKTTACFKIKTLLETQGCDTILLDGIDGRPFKIGDDFKAIFKVGENIIGIYSAGDSKSYLDDAISFGRDFNCDYLIITIRKGIHYNQIVINLPQSDSFKWYILEGSKNPDEMTIKEDEIALKIFNDIF